MPHQNTHQHRISLVAGIILVIVTLLAESPRTLTNEVFDFFGISGHNRGLG